MKWRKQSEDGDRENLFNWGRFCKLEFTRYKVKFQRHLDNKLDGRLHSELMSTESHLSIMLQKRYKRSAYVGITQVLLHVKHKHRRYGGVSPSTYILTFQLHGTKQATAAIRFDQIGHIYRSERMLPWAVQYIWASAVAVKMKAWWTQQQTKTAVITRVWGGASLCALIKKKKNAQNTHSSVKEPCFPQTAEVNVSPSLSKRRDKVERGALFYSRGCPWVTFLACTTLTLNSVTKREHSKRLENTRAKWNRRIVEWTEVWNTQLWLLK